MPATRTRLPDLLLTALAPLIWGSTYLVTTLFLPPERPFTAALLRVLPAGVLLLAAYRQVPARRDWGRITLLGVLNIGLFQAMLFVAAYRLTGGLAAILTSTQTLMVLLLTWLVGGQMPPKAAWAWAVAGVTGIYFSLQNLVGEGADRAVYEEVFAPGEKEILRAANAASPYNILHICGYAGHRNELEWYKDYDAKTINWAAVVEGVPLEEGRRIFPAHALLGGFGNLPTDILYSGTRAEVEAETQRILAAAGRTGVLLGADCTVPRDIDWNRFDWVRGAAGAR